MQAPRIIVALLLVFVACSSALASVPPMINYQGKLMQPSGLPVNDGTYSMTFAIYGQATGGTALWSEPNPSVQVKVGLFSVLLGSINNLPANIFDSPDRWFGVTVGSDPEMSPRQRIASSAFAFGAGIADTVPDGAITSAKLATGAVTASKIADQAITTGKLADGGVSSVKIADAAIDASKIAVGAVTTDRIADGAVTLGKIADGAVTRGKLAPGTYGQIGYAQITADLAYATGWLDVPGLSVTVTVPSGGSRIKITGFANFNSAWAPHTVNLAVFEGATQLQTAGTELSNATCWCSTSPQVVLTPTAGSHTYKLMVDETGTGGATLKASASYPAFILVEVI